MLVISTPSSATKVIVRWMRNPGATCRWDQGFWAAICCLQLSVRGFYGNEDDYGFANGVAITAGGACMTCTRGVNASGSATLPGQK